MASGGSAPMSNGHIDENCADGAAATSLATTSIKDASTLETKKEQLRAPWLSELSGSLGDMGTFLPLAINLSVCSAGMDFSHILITTGIFNLMTGMMFSVPMPVQPMKTIAAEAIAHNLDGYVVASAGLVVGSIVFLIGGLRVTEWLERWFPVALVVGIQVGLGLQLCMTGVKNIFKSEIWLGSIVAIVMLFFTYMCSLSEARLAALSKQSSTTVSKQAGAAQGAKGQRLAPLSGVPPVAKYQVEDQSSETPCKLSTKDVGSTSASTKAAENSKQLLEAFQYVPVALLVFILGLIIACFRWKQEGPFSFGPSPISIVNPSRLWEAMKSQGFLLGLAQLPVTMLNSVLSVCQLSETLYGKKRKAGTSAVATSVGFMNIVAALIVTMPCCHGAGGLAAQHKFGARSHVAVVFLGALKLIVGLIFGSTILALVDAFPKSLLGAMLIFVGIELASSGLKALQKEAETRKKARDDASSAGLPALRTASDYWLVLLVSGVQLQAGTGVGFLCGFACWLLMTGVEKLVFSISVGDDPPKFQREEEQNPLNGVVQEDGLTTEGVSGECATDTGPVEEASTPTHMTNRSPYATCPLCPMFKTPQNRVLQAMIPVGP